ncbi:hypothetical protein F183_A50300 [Bryobacterales bacterium F-183]|nr:hypothetical protein F183_A50300 [Bryobacterales bacterium F-183]
MPVLASCWALLYLAGQPGEFTLASAAEVHALPRTAITQWLSPETVYLITPDEREEFRDLLSDAERQAFVQQFWLRRGIEFEQEYTRRVSQANAQFTVTGPGWQSDRGRAWVILGSPESREAKPELKAEVWRYRDLELRFSAFTDDGDYALVLPRGVMRTETMQRLRLVTAP